MKKELPTAILIGAIFGFIITAAFWAIQEGKLQSFLTKETNTSEPENQKPDDSSIKTTISPEPENQTEPVVYLEINSPQDETIVTTSKLKITGQSAPFSTIVILHKEADDIITADQDGNFEQTIQLDGGLNVIKFVSFDQDGNSAEKILHITYSTAKI